MASENTAPDDGPAPDAFEAELVAYLDGELDSAAAGRVEARLATDPAARTRASELKKSFDMLDYLPRPEPSPTFTTRTLDKLPVLKPGVTRSAAPAASPRPSASRSVPGERSISTSMPIALDDDPPRPARVRRLLWAAGLLAAVAAFAAIGYVATAVARPHLLPTRDREEEAKVEVEPRVVEHLALYAVADDLAFVAELAKPEYFGDDPVVSFDATLKIPPADVSDKPTGKELDALTKAFRALPAARRAEVVKLDHDLYAKEPRERDRLFRALEAYAVWIERLPESERRGVLAQDTPGLRLGVVVGELGLARSSGRDLDLIDVPAAHVRDELAERHLSRRRPLRDERIDRHHHHDEEQPKEKGLVALLHLYLWRRTPPANDDPRPTPTGEGPRSRHTRSPRLFRVSRRALRAHRDCRYRVSAARWSE